MQNSFNIAKKPFTLLQSSSITLLCLVTVSPTAHAQLSEIKNAHQSQFSFGIGAASMQKVYRDIDHDNIALPVIGYENKYVSVAVPRADFKAYATDSLSFRVRTRIAGDGYKSKDSPYLKGMSDRKPSLWGGGAIIWNTDVVNVTTEVLGDLAGKSKGTRASLQLDHRLGFGSFGVTPRVGAEWYSNKFVDYYYGVKASEATLLRPAYKGKSDTAIDAGLSFDYSPSRNHTLFLGLGTTKFGTAIKDSPIVKKSTQQSIAVGYLYHY